MLASSPSRLLLTLALATSTALGCQVVAGLTDLELGPGDAPTTSTTSGTGGGGGQGGTGGMAGSGGDGGGGGPACDEPADCGADTTCLDHTCDGGQCGEAPATLGTSCTEDGGEVCDGQGACVPRSCADTVKNGDETGPDCGGDECPACADGLGCLDDDDCESTFCDPARSLCGPAKSGGSPCSLPSECASDHCTDGVCCDVAACGSECERCDITGLEGTCQPDVGASCGDSTDDECTNPDTCDAAGTCQPNDEQPGTGCGDPTVTLCTAADTCDGAGKCLANHTAAMVGCGSALDDACTNADTCDGQGACLPNDALVGTSCGGTCSGETLQLSSTCDGSGTCLGATSSCAPFACNGAGTACRTSCTSSNECATTGFCAMQPQTCAPCGSSPPSGSCSVSATCESCTANTCVKTCDAGGECNANVSPPQLPVPYRLECKGQCNGITVACPPGAPCEVVCEPGGCNGLTVVCNPELPCKLTCTPGACTGAVTLQCGDNSCAAECANTPVITQNCAGSCGCTKTGCL